MATKVSDKGHGWQIFDFKALIAGYNMGSYTPGTTTDTYVYQQDGKTLITLTITYQDSTKSTLLPFTWTIT